MKKQIIFLMLAIFAATSFSDAGTTINSIKKGYLFSKRPPRIHIEIILATPRSKCENFPGICGPKAIIEMEGKMHSGLETGTIAQYENGKLTLEIPKAEMGEQLIAEFSKTTVLTIDEKTNFPPAILKALQAPADVNIQTGKYPIRKTESGYIIIIDMN